MPNGGGSIFWHLSFKFLHLTNNRDFETPSEFLYCVLLPYLRNVNSVLWEYFDGEHRQRWPGRVCCWRFSHSLFSCGPGVRSN